MRPPSLSASLGPAADNVAVTQMQVIVNGAERAWVDYVTSGTVVLPDGYGTFGIGFRVRDAAGNESTTYFAGAVERRAAVGLVLNQVDNNDNVRSCGSTRSIVLHRCGQEVPHEHHLSGLTSS